MIFIVALESGGRKCATAGWQFSGLGVAGARRALITGAQRIKGAFFGEFVRLGKPSLSAAENL
jgi:hypothetical protein